MVDAIKEDYGEAQGDDVENSSNDAQTIKPIISPAMRLI